MSLTKRRLLFYFFILLFIAVVPIILLYATGNSVNWRRLELEKTGSIIVDSDPAGALLSLNGAAPGSLARQFFGQAPDPHTKTKVTGLRPGDYTLRLELSGYAPWEEKISLEPGQVHNTGTVRLFPQTNASLVADLGPHQAASLSPDGKILATASATALRLTALADGHSDTIALPAGVAAAQLAWSPDGQFLRLTPAYIFDQAKQQYISLATAYGLNPTQLSWSPDGRLWALAGTSLWQIDASTGSKRLSSELKPLIGSASVSDLRAEDGRILLLLSADGQAGFLAFDSSAPERRFQTGLPAGSYRFQSDANGDVLIHEQGRGALYRLERPLPLLSSYRVSLIAEHFSNGHWNNSELIYSTPFELRRWTNENPEELLSRWGEAVVDTARLPKSDYFIFGTANALYVRPAKNQPFADSLRLAGVERFDAFVLLEERLIYFLGRANGQDGLFKLAL